MSNFSYALYSEELGVYLGTCMGMGWWSKLDAVGQDAAVCFPSVDEARQHYLAWDCQVPDIEVRPIYPDRFDGVNHYATVQACVQAGLPAWNP